MVPIEIATGEMVHPSLLTLWQPNLVMGSPTLIAVLAVGQVEFPLTLLGSRFGIAISHCESRMQTCNI